MKLWYSFSIAPILVSFSYAKCLAYDDKPWWVHKDWDCTKIVVCLPYWPQDTGNYGDYYTPPADPDKRAESGTTITFSQDLQNFTVYDPSADVPNRVISLATLGSPSKRSLDDRGTSQCCVPTVECYNLFMEMEVTPEGSIVKVEDWMKWLCCYGDIHRGTEACYQGPGFVTSVEWQPPPQCAKFDDYNVDDYDMVE